MSTLDFFILLSVLFQKGFLFGLKKLVGITCDWSLIEGPPVSYQVPRNYHVLTTHHGVDVVFFADDSTISLASHKLSTIESSLQSDLKNIEKWCQVNKMIINVEKTKAMVISTKQKQTRSIDNFNLINLIMNNSKLKIVTEQKPLGILVTNTLNWNKHVDHVCKKIYKGIFALKKLKLYMDFKTRNLFFNAYILPHFDYCNTIWGHSEIQTRMLKLQKKSARYTGILDARLDADYSYPSRGLFKTLKWLPFISRVEFNTAILMYKSVNGQSPMYLKNMFQFCSDRHSHISRSITSLNLVPPPIKIQLFKHSFTYQGIVIWNSLSLNMKMAPSPSTFKRLYLEDMNNFQLCGPKHDKYNP